MRINPYVLCCELMRVKGFGAFENGALVRSWELVLPDEEVEALLNEDED